MLSAVLVIFLVYFNAVFAYPSGLGDQYSIYENRVIAGPLSGLDESVNAKIAQVVKSKSVNILPEFPNSGRTYAVKEIESIPSQLDTKYGRLQEFVAGFYNPKPIVDTISEREKYGNSGDKFRPVSQKIIDGFEALSNVLNTAVNVPFEFAKQTGKKITNSLNVVGEKLVGLA